MESPVNDTAADAAAPESTPSPAPRSPRMTRPGDCVATGWPRASADHLGWPAWIVRAAFVALTFVGGAGLLLYAWLWALTPWRRSAMPRATGATTRRHPPGRGAGHRSHGCSSRHPLPASSPRRSRAPPWRRRNRIAPWFWTTLAGIGLAVASGAWATFIDRPDPDRGRRSELIVAASRPCCCDDRDRTRVRRLAAVAPFPCSCRARRGARHRDRLRADARRAVARARRRARRPHPRGAAQPRSPRTCTTRCCRRSRSSRTAPALSSEVARIARAQERELRDVALRGRRRRSTATSRTELRDFAAALELDYAVTIDVVGGRRGRASAAARPRGGRTRGDAQRRAACRRRGAVYVESRPDAVEVFVRDRGPGFDARRRAGRPSRRAGVDHRPDAAGRWTATVRPARAAAPRCGCTSRRSRECRSDAGPDRPDAGPSRARDRPCPSRGDRRRPLDLPVRACRPTSTRASSSSGRRTTSSPR